MVQVGILTNKGKCASSGVGVPGNPVEIGCSAPGVRS